MEIFDGDTYMDTYLAGRGPAVHVVIWTPAPTIQAGRADEENQLRPLLEELNFR